MTKHTQGPWYVRSTGQHCNNPKLENLMICYGKDGEAICDTVYERGDANLIAAAPDLLEALKEAETALDLYGDKTKGTIVAALNVVRQSIAKAEAQYD